MELKFYSIQDVASLLHLHPETVKRYIRDGKLKSYKSSPRNILVSAEAVMEMLEKPEAE